MSEKPLTGPLETMEGWRYEDLFTGIIVSCQAGRQFTSVRFGHTKNPHADRVWSDCMVGRAVFPLDRQPCECPTPASNIVQKKPPT
jgi:hypothetical protein